MSNCKECFMQNSKLCEDKFANIESFTDKNKCPYFTDQDEAKKILEDRFYSNSIKGITEAYRQKQLERQQQRRKSILGKRYRLKQSYYRPWEFEIVNRFTDEEVEQFVIQDITPQDNEFVYSEDYEITYDSNYEILRQKAIDEIGRWIQSVELDIKEHLLNLTKAKEKFNSERKSIAKQEATYE